MFPDKKNGFILLRTKVILIITITIAHMLYDPKLTCSVCMCVRHTVRKWGKEKCENKLTSQKIRIAISANKWHVGELRFVA